jgi:hypothetical protein
VLLQQGIVSVLLPLKRLLFQGLSMTESWSPISLKRGKPIASLKDASDYLVAVSNGKRSEPLWDSAIAEVNNASVNPTFGARARDALYKALVADDLA